MRKLDIDLERFPARLPPDDMAWLRLQAAENLTSVNAELLRSVRVRREAEQQRA